MMPAKTCHLSTGSGRKKTVILFAILHLLARQTFITRKAMKPCSMMVTTAMYPTLFHRMCVKSTSISTLLHSGVFSAKSVATLLVSMVSS